MPDSRATATDLIADYATLKGSLPGHGLPWLDTLRADGLSRFGSSGLPTPKVEAWKYTNLRSLERSSFVPALSLRETVSVDQVPTIFAEPEATFRLVFVNGRARPELSRLDGLPDGVTAAPLAQVLEHKADWLQAHLGRVGALNGQPLLALNTAMMDSGYVFHVERGVVLEKPLKVVFLGGQGDQAAVYHPRNLIVMEENSQAAVIEHHNGADGVAYFANSVTEVRVDSHAILHHAKVQAEGDAAFHIATLHAQVAEAAHYDSFGLSLGGRLSRNEVSVGLNGAGADCQLNGAYLMRRRQHCDNTTVIEHRAPRTSCREIFKGVLDDDARAVFQGRIIVQREAQHTDGHQLSKALLLSDRAEIDAKPELEIYADDVKCSHGATAGELDQDHLFYLRSRGIPEPQARNLLIQAFLTDALGAVTGYVLRVALEQKIKAWLARAAEEAEA